MIRGLFLQYLYRLNDPQLEDQLIDRLSFRRFAGLPLDQAVPDFSTFWRFREALATRGLVEELFAEVNRQLTAKSLLLKQGTVVDATIIDSSGRPLSKDKRAELGESPFSKIETDADSTKKGGRYGMRWARAKTKACNQARFVMAAICWNIERSITWAKKRSDIIPAGAT